MNHPNVPDESQLFWSREKPKYPQFEPHAGMKMAQVLGSPLYIFGTGIHVLTCWEGKIDSIVQKEQWTPTTTNA